MARSRMFLALPLLLIALVGGGGASAAPTAAPFGPNVIVFDPSMPVAQIQATIDAIHARQVDAEMGTNRYALLFEPGVYGSAGQPLQLKVGYYTELAGLGASPADVTINGKIEVYNRCLDGGGTSNCVALVNFWRTLSNLSLRINAAGQDGCRASANFWAVSQAVSMRRLDITRREPLAHGLLHRRAAVRERRLHRRLEPAVRDQRLAAAVADPQQPDRRLVERGLEPGLRGRRGRAVGRDVPGPAVHDARDDARQPREAVPLRRRAGRLPGARARGADEHARPLVGRRPDAGPHDPAERLLRRDAGGLGAAHQQPARARQAPAADAGRLRRRPELESSARTRSCSASGTRRSPRSAARRR